MILLIGKPLAAAINQKEGCCVKTVSTTKKEVRPVEEANEWYRFFKSGYCKDKFDIFPGNQ